MLNAPATRLIVMLALASVSACADRDSDTAGDTSMVAATSDTAVPTELADRAREAASALGAGLQTRLFAALESGGPELGVAVCADSAQRWSAEHASEGLYLRRVSLRTRNPENRPDAIEERLLHEMDSLHRASSLPSEMVRWVTDASGQRVVQYARPILVAQPCLTCHGERSELAPAVRALLADRYPDDSAVGYSVGDLRGMITVRVTP
ncbi:MAG TPA: DUF3365 domain-containing protein [Gemmatimonadales bacterium]|nr:DUF3365 domain-containing protein [Gemmatimonadales bacterium]